MAIHLLHAMYGEDRWAGWSEDPEGRKQEGYEDHWLIDQKYQALIALEDTRRAIARRAAYPGIAEETGDRAACGASVQSVDPVDRITGRLQQTLDPGDIGPAPETVGFHENRAFTVIALPDEEVA